MDIGNKKTLQDNELGIPMRIFTGILASLGWWLITSITIDPKNFFDNGLDFQAIISMIVIFAFISFLTMCTILGKVPKKLYEKPLKKESMQHAQNTFIKGPIPTLTKLQIEIDKLGYNLKIDSKLNLSKQTSHFSCSIGDMHNTIYINTGTIYSNKEISEEFKHQVKGRKNYITMSLVGDSDNFLCVMIITLALIKSFEGVTTQNFEESNSIEIIKNLIDENLTRRIK